MQDIRKFLFALLTTMLLILPACSKSVEGESRRWEVNTSRVAELEAVYPGFKGALATRKANAQKLYEAASGLGEEQKIEKLAEANKALMAGFVGDLVAIDDKIKKLRERRVEAAAETSEATKLAAQVAAEDAQKAIERAEAALKTGASDEASAAAVLKRVHADLDAAKAALDKVLKADKAKQEKAEAAEKEAEAAKAKAEAEEAAKVAPWKCEYCSSENPHDATSCNSCGAPKKGADKAAEPAAQ
jgi:colicin import membrane protein